MNGHRKKPKGSKTIPIWTYSEAKRALPYLTSLMGSARVHRLEAQHNDLAARRLARQAGRPNRSQIIAHEEALREARQAQGQYEGAVEELQDLGIFCLDAVRGEALVPFARDKQLAWFVYDLFEPESLRFWRFHSDALDVRRSIDEIQEGPGDRALAI